MSFSGYCAGFVAAWMLFTMADRASAIETAAMKAPKSRLVLVEALASGEAASSSLQSVLLGSVRFFQQWISPIDGPRCSFSPTCSRFGYEAVHDHGPLLGVVMTADRLMRCSDWPGPGAGYPRLPDGSLHDPVARNLLKQP